MNRLGNLTKDLPWTAILLVVFTIPLSQFISTRLLILALIIYIWKCNPARVVMRAWDLLFYVLVLVCGMLVTSNIELGLRELETSLSLLAVPVMFGAVREMDEERLNSVVLVFTAGLCLTSLGIVFVALKTYLETGAVSAFLFDELTGTVDFQPTYFAYFLVFSITGLLFMLNYRKSTFRPAVLGAVTLFLFCVLMLTGGKTTFISILLVFSFFLLKYFVERNSVGQRATIGLVLLMTMGMFATSIFQEASSQFDDSWDRYDLWISAIEANTNPLWGVGTGDFRDVLNAYFVQHNMPQYAADNLNAHNQFIQRYLSNGLIGLLACVVLLGRPLYLSFRQDQTLTILLFFPFILYGMTEVFLGRYQGVVFFVVVHQLVVSFMLTRAQSGIALKQK